jgi:siroheme synthase
MHVLEDLLNELSDSTELSIASNLTLPNSRITTLSIRDWREKAYDLLKSPAVFLIGRGE